MPMSRLLVPPQNSISRKQRVAANVQGVGSRAVDPAYYCTPIRQVAASGTDVFSIPIQEDGEFLCEFLTGIIAADAGAGVPEWRLGSGATENATDGITDAAMTIRITDTGSNRQINDRFAYWHTIVGTAQNPCYLPIPKHFFPNSNVQVEVVNLIAVASVWQLVLGGTKIYRAGRV
jgi:hypothetical protein